MESAFDMISRFLEMHCVIVTVLFSKELSKSKAEDVPHLSEDELRLAEEIVKCLKPMKDVKTMLCCESSPTVSMVMPVKHILLNSILAPCDVDTRFITEMKKIMVTDLASRYSTQEDILNVAAATDPRFKNLPYLTDAKRFEVFSRVTTETASDIEALQAQPVMVKTEPQDQQAETTPPLPQLQLEAETTQASEGITDLDDVDLSKPILQSKCNESKKSLIEDLLGDVFIVKTEPATSAFDRAQVDVTKYKAYACISLKEDCLLWWKKHQFIYPNLTRLAKKFLSIPATSVPSERAFLVQLEIFCLIKGQI